MSHQALPGVIRGASRRVQGEYGKSRWALASRTHLQSILGPRENHMLWSLIFCLFVACLFDLYADLHHHELTRP